MVNLSADDEIRLVEVLKHDVDLRLMQDADIGATDGLLQLRNRNAFCGQLLQAFQCNIPVRLHTDGLVIFRRECEGDRDYITFAKPVQRTAYPRQGWTPVTARHTGFRGHRWPGRFSSPAWQLFLSHGRP